MDELYVLAREVLLDALEALEQHRNAIILVGAQAIYLHVGAADLAVAPYTTDGDLVLNPQLLGQNPALEEALTGAGFVLRTADSVGIWLAHRETSTHPKVEVAVDLLVPQSVSPGTGRRAANLSGHSHRAARIVSGLEGALVDNAQWTLTSLREDSERRLSIAVAGPAALLIAKVHKIQDRGSSLRANDKDALDVFRLLRGISAENFVTRFLLMMNDARSKAAATAGIALLEEQFGTKAGFGTRMAARSLQDIMNEDEVVRSCELLAKELLLTLKESHI